MLFRSLHAWRFTPADTVFHLGWGTGAPWALGYLAMAVVFLLGWWSKRCLGGRPSGDRCQRSSKLHLSATLAAGEEWLT